MGNIKPIVAPKLKKDTLKNLAMGAIIFLIISAYSLFDIFTLHFDITLMTTISYWATVALNTFLIVLFILTIRKLRKDHNINKPIKVKDENGNWVQKANDLEIFMNNLNRGYNTITKDGLSDKLEKYLIELNKDKKCSIYKKIVRDRLEKLKNKIRPEMRKGGVLENSKKAKRLIIKETDLTALLKLTRDEIWGKKFKYKAVTVSKLFSSISGRTIDDDETNIDPEEGKAVRKLITTKMLWVVIFAAGTASIVPSFLVGFGWIIIIGIILKLITLLMAANLGMADADDFVNINLKTSLQRRVRILADFTNANNLGELNFESEVPEVKTPIVVEIPKLTPENIAVPPDYAIKHIVMENTEFIENSTKTIEKL